MKSLSILFFLLLSSPANGMVYSWTDSAGITHYTNKEYDIPLRYRAKVKARYPEQGDSSTTLQNVPTPQVEKSVQAQPQASLANHPEPVKAAVQAGETPDIQKMKEERIARKARRNRKADDE